MGVAIEKIMTVLKSAEVGETEEKIRPSITVEAKTDRTRLKTAARTQKEGGAQTHVKLRMKNNDSDGRAIGE